MSTALTTVFFNGANKKVIDLDISLSITAGHCLELLKQANWLPDNWEFKCEVSCTGEVWTELGQQVVLADVIQGDGAIIRIYPY
ncbi:hypothetical protein QW71_26480 [Paenibacillus sp. IHB B 3415]|uniref:hypothetical protein n=1 Tax=Paenibacillus sp. IHB B 3415 TaxID=867080 RepID=UPI000575498D|nr:hypothetical protein [Paenibacillus sp. IHB B 3415]KHL92938.1 hypothetical protein QW71_26480 [Paenibacillus sp. IHB B 3415]